MPCVNAQPIDQSPTDHKSLVQWEDSIVFAIQELENWSTPRIQTQCSQQLGLTKMVCWLPLIYSFTIRTTPIHTD